MGARYEVFTDDAGAYRFRLKARNGKVILQSEGYKTRQGAVGGIRSIQRNADAPISDYSWLDQFKPVPEVNR